MAMRLEPPGFGTEDKYTVRRDYDLTIGTTGHMEFLSYIEKGLDKSQRVGRIVHYNYLDFWYYAYQKAFAPPDWRENIEPWLLRVTLLYDRQSNATAVTYQDILDTVVCPDWALGMAPLRADHPLRWTFLDDHKVWISNYYVGAVPANDIYHARIDLSGLSSYWKDEGGDCTSCVSGGIWAYFHNGFEPATTYNIFTSELHFTDP